MLFLSSCFIVPSHICAILLILAIHNAVGQHIFGQGRSLFHSMFRIAGGIQDYIWLYHHHFVPR